MAAAAKKAKPSTETQEYMACIAAYEREFKKWESRVERIIKRYRDEDRPSNKTQSARFNILWSNVQTLVPATFSRLPQPDVSRRFRDTDPVGRVAALILERSLDFEIQHYNDYRASMRQCVHDRFLGGRGTVWARYDPHFKQSGETGAQITEDAGDSPMDEALDYECAPIDYVHWKDFGHEVTRTWEENTKVWRKVYMGEEAVTDRFGVDVAKKVPYDATPEEMKRAGSYKSGEEGTKKQACIIELWDKTKGRAVWFTKSLPDFLDEREDPLGLQEFFPCPRPLYSTLTNETLVPVPDFSLYQDQAKELDTYADRIDGLTQMLQLKGVYDASADSSLGRLFTEGTNGTLMPVKNWAAFAEKNGLQGQIDVYDLTPLANALKIAQEGMEQVKNQVYEITGISDIIRGQTEASETATAQQIKGQYASLRLRAMQDEVAQFATDCLRLKAQIICAKFKPETIAAIAAVEQLSPEDQQHVYQMQPPAPPQLDPMTGQPMPPAPPQPVMGQDGKPVPLGPAMLLLIGQARAQDPEADTPNPLRAFRIEVAADTLVQIDEQREKQDRMEFLEANGSFLEKATLVLGQAGAAAPALLPAIMELWKYGVTAFKVGKNLEGTLDQAADQLKKLAAQPPKPQQDPAMVKAEADIKLNEQKHQQDLAFNQQKHQDEMQFKREEHGMKLQQQQVDNEMKTQQMAFDQGQQEKKAGFEREQGEKQMAQDEKLGMAKIEAGKKPTTEVRLDANEQIGGVAKNLEALHGQQSESISQAAQVMTQAVQMLAQAAKELSMAAKQMGGPKRHIRGADGRITHTVPEQMQ